MNNSFPATSRYALVETATITGPDGGTIRYLRRRFVPQPETLAQIGTHETVEGDRLDLVAYTNLGDPQQFWRIADANRAMMPADLELPVGRRLRITLPDGIPGGPHA